MTSITDWILSATAVLVAVIAILPRAIRRFRRPLRIGDRLRLTGGYEDPPEWLQGHPYVCGRAVAFIPDKEGRSAVAVALDSPLFAEGTSYSFVLLRLRYADARWSRREFVHVELWVDVPSSVDSKASGAPRHKWIESHAAYRVVT